MTELSHTQTNHNFSLIQFESTLPSTIRFLWSNYASNMNKIKQAIGQIHASAVRAALKGLEALTRLLSSYIFAHQFVLEMGLTLSIDFYCYTRHSEVPAQRDKVITSRSNYLAPVTRFLGGPECLL